MIAERMFGVREVLIPAIKLIPINGIEVETEVQAVTYWHMLFETHQLVWSNGAPADSIFTGPEALKGMTPEGLAEIAEIFPEITGPEFHAELARPVPPTGKAIGKLLARRSKNNKPLVSLGVDA